MPDQIKVALFGVGHLGKIHIQCIQQSQNAVLIGVWDLDKEAETKVILDNNLSAYSSEEELIRSSDAVFIITPTPAHLSIALKAIEFGKHLFIEKPVTLNVEEANQLKLKLSAQPQLKCQIGHVERFNPAFVSAYHQIRNPLFIEGHRLAEFKARGTDVSVVMDLMIHDLDLVLNMVHSPVREIRASGVSVMSKTPDICNARIEFANGTVANLTASRISLKQMRKLRIFQSDAYIGIDLLKKESQIVRMADRAPDNHPFTWPVDTKDGVKHISIEAPSTTVTNAIVAEINAFTDSIIHQTEPIVSLIDGIIALQVAEQILAQIEANSLLSAQA